MNRTPHELLRLLSGALILNVFYVSHLIAQTPAAPGAPLPGSQPAATGTAASIYPLPPEKYFNDYAGITRQTVQDAIEKELSDFDTAHATKVVVAIFKTKTAPGPLADYCTQTFNGWHLGQSGKDNGVALFVFIDDGVMRIIVGRDMAKVLTQADCEKILNRVIAPQFKARQVDAGFAYGAAAILKLITEPHKP